MIWIFAGQKKGRNYATIRIALNIRIYQVLNQSEPDIKLQLQARHNENDLLAVSLMNLNKCEKSDKIKVILKGIVDSLLTIKFLYHFYFIKTFWSAGVFNPVHHLGYDINAKSSRFDFINIPCFDGIFVKADTIVNN